MIEFISECRASGNFAHTWRVYIYRIFHLVFLFFFVSLPHSISIGMQPWRSRSRPPPRRDECGCVCLRVCVGVGVFLSVCVRGCVWASVYWFVRSHTTARLPAAFAYRNCFVKRKQSSPPLGSAEERVRGSVGVWVCVLFIVLREGGTTRRVRLPVLFD